jgi:hypothetical protein
LHRDAIFFQWRDAAAKTPIPRQKKKNLFWDRKLTQASIETPQHINQVHGLRTLQHIIAENMMKSFGHQRLHNAARYHGFKGKSFTPKGAPTAGLSRFAAEHLDILPPAPQHRWDVSKGRYVHERHILDGRFKKPRLKAGVKTLGGHVYTLAPAQTALPTVEASGSLTHTTVYTLPATAASSAEALDAWIAVTVPRTFAKYDRVQFALRREGGNSTSTMTPFMPFDMARERVIGIWLKNEAKYTDMAPAEEFLVRRMSTATGAPLPLTGSGARRLQGATMSASAKWLILPNPAETNCFHRAIILHRSRANLKKLQPISLNSRAKSYKRDLGKRVKLAASNAVAVSELQSIVDSNTTVQHAFSITLYDNLFQRTGTYTPGAVPKPRENIELQLRDGHYLPLLRWAETDWTRDEWEAAEGVKCLKAEHTQDDYHLIRAPRSVRWCKRGETGSNANPRAAPVERETRFAACDIEAAPTGPGGHFKAYMCGIAWYGPDGEECYESWEGTDCLREFTDWLDARPRLFKVLYYHNGGAFDVRLMLRESWARRDCPFRLERSLYSNDRFLKVGLQHKKSGARMKVLDTCALLSQPLAKMGVSFGVAHAKLTGTIDHDMVTLENWSTIPMIREYQKADCQCLLEVADAYSKDVAESANLNLTDYVSASSLARATLLANHYDEKRTPLFRLPRKIDRYIRRAYVGGRVECFWMGRCDEDSGYSDLTSLFPHAMTMDLPYGKGTEMEPAEINELGTSFTGYLRVRARTIDDKQLPLLPIKRAGKLIFPIMRSWTEMIIYHAEYHKGVALKQYEFEILDGIQFNVAPHMRSFSQTLVRRKAECRAAGDGAGAASAKTSVNAGYGIWGQDCEGRQTCVHYEGEEYLKAYHEGRLVHLGEKAAGMGYTTAIIEEDIEADVCVAVAAAVTSLSRLVLYGMLCTIRDDLGCQLLYCDTDSVIACGGYDDLNGDYYNHPLFMSRHVRDGAFDIRKAGTALGSTKNELTELYPKSSPWYEHPRATTGGLLFNTVWIAGLKFYALRKNADEFYDKPLSLCKAKGLSQKNGCPSVEMVDAWVNAKGAAKEAAALDIKRSAADLSCDHFDDICDGERLQAFGMQFAKPTTNLCHAADYGKVTKKYVAKKFAMQYTKGTWSVENPRVTPLEI